MSHKKQKEITIKCTKKEFGLRLECEGEDYLLKYSKQIWQKYPEKDVLIDNLTHLLTINIPVVSKKINTIQYNTSLPLFKQFFKNMVQNGIPHATEDYKETTQEALKRFKEAKYIFKDKKVKHSEHKLNTQDRALISLSCGKDSLLTLAVSQELGLKPTGVYINDTVTPIENKAKLTLMKKVATKFNIKTHIVTNEIEQLVDYETWKENETMLCYTHMMTGFCFIALPFIHYHKTKHLILGNEQDMDFTFTNKDGFLTYPSYDQSTQWTAQQDIVIKKMTSNSTNVFSLIRPLTNLAIIKILHTRYKQYGKYEFSCDCLNQSTQKRWCSECNKCARLFILMKAFGLDPKTLHFPHNLLQKKYEKYYVIFNKNGSEIDCYEKSKEAFDQQLLAFYLAYKNNAKGYLIDLFKKKYLKEVKQREDELINKFLNVYKAPEIPPNLRRDLYSIYKEELN